MVRLTQAPAVVTIALDLSLPQPREARAPNAKPRLRSRECASGASDVNKLALLRCSAAARDKHRGCHSGRAIAL